MIETSALAGPTPPGIGAVSTLLDGSGSGVRSEMTSARLISSEPSPV